MSHRLPAGYVVHMGELRLYAIAVDEVRDVFSASPALADDFRRVVADAFPPQTTEKAPGMLGKLGPLFRRPAGAIVLTPDTPVEEDVADLLAGRYVRPERLPAAWRLMEAYLATKAWGRHLIDLDVSRFNDLEFDLARAGMDPRLGLGKLVNTMPNNLGFTDEQTQAFRASMPLLLAVFLGLIMWPGLARLVRSEFLTLREREFVDAARVSGAGDWRIITKHMLPNSIGVIIVNTTLLMSAAVVLETALSFLGFGINRPNISLGFLINTYQGAFATRPWLFWWPGLFIILIALSVNFIGDGLRDAFDPRTRRIPSKREMDKALAKVQAGAAEKGGAR